ncbi:MAG: hypothetical protein E7Z93_05705 [Cyanobacteria bacterium SIG32]|nr:hypothetical protein [Cyanobacteria bacterium SIG32]
MIHSVSPVSFRSATAAASAAQDPFSRPGKFTMPEAAAPEAAPKKKGKFLKKLAIGVGVAAAVAAGLIVGVRTGKLNQVQDLANAGIMQKAGHYLAVAGDWLNTKAWQPVAKFFSNLGSKASANS